MKNIKILFFSLILICTFAWLFTGDYIKITQGYFAFRKEFIQVTGLISFCAMSVDIVLALRLTWIENILHGLDKAYRLHKWLGITALVAAIIHWLLAKGTKWAISWGWLVRPPKNILTPNLFEKNDLELFLLGWKKNAEFLGEWVFYITIILGIITLVKLFPYHFFRNYHTFFIGVYLIIVFHTIILTKFSYWLQPFGFLIFIFILSGSISALVVIFHRLGFRKRYYGSVIKSEQDQFTNTHVLTIRLNDAWPGHETGQFAFITLDKKEGAHPFTIASPWNSDDPTLIFHIKTLGDYTKAIQNSTFKNQKVQIEGPYGRFYFNNTPHQIWIAAGVGITPFLARLKELKQHSPKRTNINFIYAISSISPKNSAALQNLAQSAGINLTIWSTLRDGRLNSKVLMDIFPDWKQAEIWFCGPAIFGKNLEKDFLKQGAIPKKIHRELFDMR